MECRKILNAQCREQEAKKLEAFDQWLLVKLSKLIETCADSFESYDSSRAKQEIETFFWHVFCDNYLEIIKDRIYNNKPGKDSARYALYAGFLNTLKLFAPIMPYITEELYQIYFKSEEKEKSIHISEFPKSDNHENEKLEKAGDRAVEIIKEVRMFKSRAQKSMKSPIILTIEEKDKKMLKDFMDDLKSVTGSQKIETGKFNIKLVE